MRFWDFVILIQMSLDIKIITLPVSRWQEYKLLRLEALEKESQAFGAKYIEAKAKPDDEWTERVKRAEIEDKDIMLFAEDNGQLIGMIGAYFKKSEENQEVANIWGVYVSDAYRGNGIGKQLMEAIVARLKKVPDLKSVKLMVNQEQKPAVSLYQQLGFNIVGTEKFVLGDGKEHDEYIMEKVI